MLARLRCEGEHDEEFGINGNRVCNETFIEEFIGSIGNGNASGLDENRDGLEFHDGNWTDFGAQRSKHHYCLHREIVQALTEIICVSLIITKSENKIKLRLAQAAEILRTPCYWKY
jgi:hypothetical protein